MTAAELSRLLFVPITPLLYVAAAIAYTYAMAFSTVDRVGDEGVGKGRRARALATAFTLLGLVAHVGHVVSRMIASERVVPLGNMFEFSNVIAITIVVGGLVVIQRRMRRPELMGFVLLGALITMGMAILIWSEPGPIAPILDSWWLSIHVTTISIAAGILAMGAVFNALQLLRDTAEARVARLAEGSYGAGTVGAAQAPVTSDVAEGGEDVDGTVGTIDERISKDAGDVAETSQGYDTHLRDVLAERVLGLRGPWRIAVGTTLVSMVVSLPFWDPVVTLTFAAATPPLVVLAWWSVPHLPSASKLDSLAYRTIAFAFPLLTFAIITGAIWAEQSWGRFWGWDPKETSAFLTWVAYAGYLHARATKGFRGRRAAWVGLASYGVWLFTYYVVNLWISGLHSYAGLQ